MKTLTLLLICLVSPWAHSAVAAASEEFDALLAEGELQFSPPDGFTELPPGRNPILDYEHALRSGDGKLEVRMAIRPLNRMQIDYDDPHGAVPNPNHIFPLVFESLATRLSGGQHAPSNEYPAQHALEKFNADWAAAAVFDTVEDYQPNHKQGLLIAMHRNKVSDAYLVILFDDYQAIKPQLEDVMRTLVYVPRPEGDDNGALPMMGSH